MLKKILLSLFWLTIMSSSLAQDIDTAEQELAALQQNMAKISHQLQVERETQSDLQTELREYELAIAKVSKRLTQLTANLAERKAALTQMQATAADLQQAIQQQQANLAASLRAVFASGQQLDLKLLLNQENPADWRRLLLFYRYFNAAIFHQLETLSTQLALQAEIEEEINQSILQIENEAQQEQVEQANLSQQQAQRAAVLASIQAQIANREFELTELAASEQELQQVLAVLYRGLAKIPTSNDFLKVSDYKGELPWPVHGQTRGVRGANRQGLMIVADSQEPVSAIFPGRVVYADWLRGFGLLIIIDHGYDFLSLYAHNHSLYRDVGEWVNSGDLIATVGNSGGVKESELYFELRHQGKAIDPKQWLEKLA